MHDLGEKIDQYSEELFVDLGLASLPEEEKADVFARLKEHLHKVILDTLASEARGDELKRTQQALEEEDYRKVGKILKRHPRLLAALEQKIENEFSDLKLTIAEEQKNAREPRSEDTPS